MWGVGIILAVLVILFVEPVRHVFLLGVVVGAAALAEVLARVGDLVVWLGDGLVWLGTPVLTEVLSWF